MRGRVLFPGSAALDLPTQTPTAVRWLERRGWTFYPSLDRWERGDTHRMSAAFVERAVADHGVLVFTRVVRTYEETGKDTWTDEEVRALMLR